MATNLETPNFDGPQRKTNELLGSNLSNSNTKVLRKESQNSKNIVDKQISQYWAEDESYSPSKNQLARFADQLKVPC